MSVSSVYSLTIIIPIYNAYYETRACIKSVAENSPLSCSVFLINDASTDARISFLIKHAAQTWSNFSAFSNQRNLGYTATVNRGLRLARNSDVILLNSDTIVSPGWVEKIIGCARKRKNVATVTPVSNSAGVFSVPVRGRSNLLPPGFSVSEMAGLVEILSPGLQPCVPVGNGFCIYISRKAIDRVGGFDEKNFPDGYGSENDFCMRASKAGFIHRVEDSTFIFHSRSASFGFRKYPAVFFAGRRIRRLYPEHDLAVEKWLKNDPLNPLREVLKNYFKSKSCRCWFFHFSPESGKTKRIMINSYNTIGAGPAAISLNIAEGLYRYCRNRHVWFFVPGIDLFWGLKSTASIRIIRLPSPSSFLKFLLRAVFEILVFPVCTLIIRPDSLVAIANYSPMPVYGKKIVFLRHYFLIDPASARDLPYSGRLLEACRRLIFALSLLTADVVVVQSDYMKQQLIGTYRVKPGRVKVLANPVRRDHKFLVSENTDPGRSRQFSVLYISRFYPHKNHGFLLKIAEEYKDWLSRHHVRFIITVDPHQANVDPLVRKKARNFISMVEKKQLFYIINNIGEVSQQMLYEHYRNATCLFFPSLSESFGNPVAEAMAYGLPVIVPDLAWARAICGSAGIYYDSSSTRDAFDKIKRVISDEAFVREYERRSLLKAASFPDTRQWLESLFKIADKERDSGK